MRKKESFYRSNKFIIFLIIVILIGLVISSFAFDIIGKYINPIFAEKELNKKQPSQLETEKEPAEKEESKIPSPEGPQKVGTVSIIAGGSTSLEKISVG